MHPRVLPLRPPAEAALEARDAPAGFVVGAVVELRDGAIVAVAVAGEILPARRAFSCLVAPFPGDSVLLAPSADGLWLLAILARPESRGATLALPTAGGLTISADEIHIVARAAATLEAPRLTLRASAFDLVASTATLLGRLVTLMAETLRLSARDHEVAADTIATKALDRVTIVDRSDVLRAGQLSQTIGEVAVTTAPIAVVATEEDLRLDGKRVTVG